MNKGGQGNKGGEGNKGGGRGIRGEGRQVVRMGERVMGLKEVCIVVICVGR